ncbi:MAG: metallophosphoesterase [Acidobacteria bacterium]|nr:metallophosphoesterase [Acidobacteriota bacterium]
MSDSGTASQPRILTRRRFLVGLGAAALGGTGLYGYAYGPGRHHVVVVEHDVYIPDLPAAFNGFTIAQMSDFHFGPVAEAPIVDHAVDIVNAIQPSLTVLTGDFITADHHNNQNNLDAAARAAIALSRINGPRFASLGNHDTIDLQGVIKALVSRKIPVLRNARVALESKGERMWLAGVADICLDLPDPLKTLPEYTLNEPVILLGHAPDYVDDIVKVTKVHNRRCDLMLCGHTHGGQVNLPLVTRGMLPDWGKKYVQGPFQRESTLLYVNRGLGTIHLPIRFNAPPEITIFHLHA